LNEKKKINYAKSEKKNQLHKNKEYFKYLIEYDFLIDIKYLNYSKSECLSG